MDTIVVKTEVQNNGEILLYYVDENGESQEGVLATVENVENDTVANFENPLQPSSYVLNYDELVDEAEVAEESNDTTFWSDEDTTRLLTFYNDNKAAFISGRTQKEHLWAVACKTMLIGKDQNSCEEKLNELKGKYFKLRSYIEKGLFVKWPFLESCHSAFHDDENLNAKKETEIVPETQLQIVERQAIDGIYHEKVYTVKKPDEQMKRLLDLYYKHRMSFKKVHWRRELWDRIAREMGEEDGEYFQKKFLNYKQHYIALCQKRKEEGSVGITWPYMEQYDKIFRDDVQFHKKHLNEDIKQELPTVPEHEWNMTQMMILAKYYFDCFDEFQDPTIPKKFLWTEVGRYVDKKPESCETKYQTLRREHLDKIIAGDYNVDQRMPLAVLLDSTIAKDVQTELLKTSNEHTTWVKDSTDELVQFVYTNLDLFKDKVGHFVCWAAIAQKLNTQAKYCYAKWSTLVDIYEKKLEEKKNNAAVIGWRYIELFDRIFDCGMDKALLKGYTIERPKTTNKVVVKHLNIKPPNIDINLLVEKASIPQKSIEPLTDPRSTKILEYYFKNKEKFKQAPNKVSHWDPFAKEIGMDSSECAHRFNTLKQIYFENLNKVVEQPNVSVSWPYFDLCKKVFGFRNRTAVPKNWLVRDIRRLIAFFSEHFHDINGKEDNISVWAPLAAEIGKSELNCKQKFVELRKCYRKLKTKQSRNPETKISWNYFDMFDRIYRTRDSEPMEVDSLEEHLATDGEVADEDYQCIIVVQDGQVILQNPEDINNPEILQQISKLSQNVEIQRVSPTNKWTKRQKKKLLIFYINYLVTNRGKEIDTKQLWTTIASRIQSKTPKECKKMLNKMVNAYNRANDKLKSNSAFGAFLERVIKLKAKLKTQQRVYKDVTMPAEKVQTALKYYLDNIEEFIHPQFKKKYQWSLLADYISEPTSNIYNKVNYLKQAFNIETEEINGEKTPFSALLKEIIAKEVAVKMVLDVNSDNNMKYDENDNWTDEEVKILLTWYSTNLEKFKSPKYNNRYLWVEAANVLGKSPLNCSKKVFEMRTLYRNVAKDTNEQASKDWRFFELCHKVYGAATA